MIRTPDRKSASPVPVCYEEAPQTAFGIAFEKRDGTRRFVPYAFLSALDFNGLDELTFHFTSGTVTARGTVLEALWKAACRGELARVWESEPLSDHIGTWVRELTFSEPEPDSAPDLPPFPQDPLTS